MSNSLFSVELLFHTNVFYEPTCPVRTVKHKFNFSCCRQKAKYLLDAAQPQNAHKQRKSLLVSLCSCFFVVQEKQERAIGLLVSLGPQPGSEVTPWYMKTGKDKEERKEKEERKDKEKRKGISEEEREKKDRRLKDSLDPLKDMKKALAIKDRKHHKSKKGEKRDKGERRSSGER